MIDLAALRQDPDAVKKSQAARGESVELVDQVVTADAARRTALGEFESLRANQKAIGTQVAKATGDEKQALLGQTKTLSDQVKAAENALREMDANLDALVLGLSNVVDPAAPVGGEDDFVVIKEVGTKRNFAAEGIAVRDHVEIGELLGAIDIERGAKVSGSRFYYLTGPGAMLELALVQLAMNTAQKNGFIPMIPPALVKPAAMEGTGFLGQAAELLRRLAQRPRADPAARQFFGDHAHHQLAKAKAAKFFGDAHAKSSQFGHFGNQRVRNQVIGEMPFMRVGQYPVVGKAPILGANLIDCFVLKTVADRASIANKFNKRTPVCGCVARRNCR